MIDQTWLILVVSIVFWIVLFPESALEIITSLKQQLRSRLIKRTREAAAKQVEHSLRQFAADNGIDTGQVNKVVSDLHSLIQERIGDKWANQILGEAEPTKRLD
jgi:hypothetical protein